MNTTCIKIEGGLLAPDFLEAIADAEGQKPSDFGIEGRRTLVDEVSALWSDVRSYWDAFQRRLQRQSGESLTTITREQWVIPLLDALGYRLTYHPQGVEIEGRNYRISHRTGETCEDLPVHIEPFDQDLGSRPPSGRGTMSPHAMVQDYLNRTDHLWAIVTNGSTLRLLRDSSFFTRPSFVEFDLRQMLEGERLDEFFLFYRLVHRSRLPKTMDDGPHCLLERYHQLGIEQGGRIRDGLRNAVEQAIVILANGFLSNGFTDHRDNARLREDLESGKLSAADFYRQLLYLIYRLLFLIVAEERGLLTVESGEQRRANGDGQPSTTRNSQLAIRPFFSIQRLRALADEPLSAPERFCDLYLNLRALFYSLCNEDFAEALGLPPLNGELFDCARTSALGDAYLNNRDLLTAMHTLSWFVPRDQRVPTRVNYRHLDVEELGSVYESLLDLQPIVEEQGGRLTFRFGTGTERKTTGSYYTRPELVQELIKSALVPVIEDRLTSPPAPSPPGGEGKSRPSGTGMRSDVETRREVEPVPGYVYDLARKLRKEGTDSEALLWQCLRNRQLGGCKFRRQHPLGRYIADFYCAEARLVVELDGAPHRDERQAEYDQLRDEEIARHGLTVLRIPSAQAQRDPEGVLDTIARHLPRRCPSPPSGEGMSRQSGTGVRSYAGAGGEVDPREQALLSLTVCDPACGSGHFLLAAARRIGTELAKVRTGEEAPAPDAVREAVRDVITHCIYGVDKNPLAVDLCKVALWIEGHSGGKPLTFLDHRIRCGDSLVGVFDLTVLEEGIPDAAFDPVSGDDKAVARAIKKRNKAEREGQTTLPLDAVSSRADPLAIRHSLLAIPDDTPADVHHKREAYEEWQRSTNTLRMACHMWTAAFFWPLTAPHPRPSDSPSPLVERGPGGEVPTTETLRRFLQNPDSVDARLKGYAWALAERNRFFHWPLEFPEVFEQGGFDCVLGNPPWGQLKLEERGWFKGRDDRIADEGDTTKRDRLIESLAAEAPALHAEWIAARCTAEYQSRFMQGSGRFPRTACGNMDTYPLFTEHVLACLGAGGRAGIVIKTGLLVNETWSGFVRSLLATGRLVRAHDFVNTRLLFPGLAPPERFTLLTLAADEAPGRAVTLSFLAEGVEQLRDPERVYTLRADDILAVNPNTGNLPQFQRAADAQLTAGVYQRVPILRHIQRDTNPWGLKYHRMYDMKNDAGSFRSNTLESLTQAGWELGSDGIFRKGDDRYLPLYEAKLFDCYNHRFGTFEGVPPSRRFVTKAQPNHPSVEHLADPTYAALPRYWVDQSDFERKTRRLTWHQPWTLAIQDVTQVVSNQRVATGTLVPWWPLSNKCPAILFPGDEEPHLRALLFLSVFASLPFDYVVRQKLAGASLNLFILEQLAAPTPGDFEREFHLNGSTYSASLLATRWALELVCVTQSLLPFGEPFGVTQPYPWDEQRRFHLRRKLDALVAHLYGMSRPEFEHALTAFRIINEQDIAKHGRLRTTETCLHYYDCLTRGEMEDA